MAFNEVMNKVRQWDNRAAQWMIRHFYILFFEIILVIIFVLAFINVLKVLDDNADVNKSSVMEKLLLTQSINSILIVVLMLFNSFWILYIFNSILKLRGVLKNIEFSLSKRRTDQRSQDD